jgi:hypothetical protein
MYSRSSITSDTISIGYDPICSVLINRGKQVDNKQAGKEINQKVSCQSIHVSNILSYHQALLHPGKRIVFT